MKVISITGGKGGIGKTTISVNLAMAYAKSGKKVLVFDADLGLANVDVMLGIKPKKTIEHFINGECTLSDIVVTGPYGIKVIPASSGIQSTSELTDRQASDLIHAFSTLVDKMDIMLIDLASGISRQVIDFTHAAQNIVVVICNDPASLMDSYAVIKILHTKYQRNRFGVVVNKVKNLQEGYQIYLGFQETVSRFMNVGLEYLGHIPCDDYVGIAARENVTVYDRFPVSPSSIAFRNLQNGILNWSTQSPSTGGIQFFFERLIKSENEGDLCKV